MPEDIYGRRMFFRRTVVPERRTEMQEGWMGRQASAHTDK